MTKYYRTPHLVYDCKYHVIFCPKYRRGILVNGLNELVKSVFLKIAEQKDFQIIEMEVMPDHVHLLISCNPRFGIMNCIRALKQYSAAPMREFRPIAGAPSPQHLDQKRFLLPRSCPSPWKQLKHTLTHRRNSNMTRTKTDSFILELKLKTSMADAVCLEKCFAAGHSIYNILVRHCRRQIASFRQDQTCQELLAEYRIQKDGNERKAVSEQLKALVAAYGLTEYSLHSFVKVQQKKHKKYINSLVAQKIASSVWKGVEKVLYGNGKLLRFRKYTEFISLEGKNNSTGLIFQDGILKVNGRPIYVSRHKRDGSASRLYENEALKHRVKYCRLVRKPVGSSWHYYVQLVLEGTAPVKHSLGSGRAGLDIGTSTAAVATRQECILTVLGESVEDIEKEQRRLLRKNGSVSPGHEPAEL